MALIPDRRLALLKRKRAILAARDDLIAFTQLMMPDPNYDDDVNQSLYKPQRFHRVIGAALEEVERALDRVPIEPGQYETGDQKNKDGPDRRREKQPQRKRISAHRAV